MSPLQQVKLMLVEYLDLAKDALHVYVGLLIFFAIAALFRLSLRDWCPILAVLLVALAGEIWDILDTLGGGRAPVLSRNWKDIWNTLLWPAMIFLLARHTALLRR